MCSDTDRRKVGCVSHPLCFNPSLYLTLTHNHNHNHFLLSLSLSLNGMPKEFSIFPLLNPHCITQEAKLAKSDDFEKVEKERRGMKLGRIAEQLVKHKNLRLFTFVSALQVFECTFEKNFLSIFVDVLMQGVSQRTRSLIISSSFVLPWIVTIMIAPAVTRFGARNVIYGTFCLKMTLSAVALCVGYRRPLFIGAFAVISRVLTECVCRLNPLVLADLVDEVIPLPSPCLFHLLPPSFLHSFLSSTKTQIEYWDSSGTQAKETCGFLMFAFFARRID